jgi:hypothetical protein
MLVKTIGETLDPAAPWPCPSDSSSWFVPQLLDAEMVLENDGVGVGLLD